MTACSDNLATIEANIQAALSRSRFRQQVRLVAVSKKISADRVFAAYQAGQRLFGENTVQEGVGKQAELIHSAPEAQWLLIGHLQSNKSKQALVKFAEIQSVDTLALARRLNMQAQQLDMQATILLEVNVAGEASKSGFNLESVAGIFPEVLDMPALRIRGLMTIAPLSANPEDVRGVFGVLRELRDTLREKHDATELVELSMGMSDDYQVAIEEGATIVRIGRAIFGERPVL